jgi:hypothetical protein
VFLLGGLVLAGQQSPPANPYPWGGQDASVPLPEKVATPAVDYNPRDFSGVWLRSGGASLTDDLPPKMTARGQALWDATVTGRSNAARDSTPPVSANDPIAWCDPYGFPRILSVNRPVEMVHTSTRIVQLFEWSRVWRDIWLDGRALPADPDPRWMGYSVGRWEGDTLVVETIGFNEKTWMDQYGYPYSAGARFVERWRRVDATTILHDATLFDPDIYTEPWVGDTRTFRLLPRDGWPQAELREEFCAPSEERSFNERVRDPAGGVIHK